MVRPVCGGRAGEIGDLVDEVVERFALQRWVRVAALVVERIYDYVNVNVNVIDEL